MPVSRPLLIAASAPSLGNSANELVDAVNQNRTAHKLSKLYNNPGLGCMALQFIERCRENCTSSSAIPCQPVADDITEIFAPNCRVELPTVDNISRRLIRCHYKYLPPDQAFSEILVPDNKTLSMILVSKLQRLELQSKASTRAFFFGVFCLAMGSTFVLEGGHVIKQKRGCYSGADTPCNSATTFRISVQ